MNRVTPVCADIDHTLNLDPRDLERCITPKTKAVIVVHMLGTPARLSEIKDICRRHNLFLIEDTAWGCGGSLNDKFLGTWGDVGAFSFDFAKTMTTGEGGMIVFNHEEHYLRAAVGMTMAMKTTRLYQGGKTPAHQVVSTIECPSYRLL